MVTAVMRILPALVFLATLLPVTPAHAGVVIAGTRVVYPAQEKEVTVSLQNAGQRPALVQLWIDDGDQDTPPELAKAPFVVTPPLLRMEGGDKQAMRIRFAGPAQPTDRESVFWLNMLEIPPSSDSSEERLELAFRSRIKLFYRPAGLPGDAETAHRQLRWSLQRGAQGVSLQVDNPTPWHVSFADVGLRVGGVEAGQAGSGMVAPRSSRTFVLEGLSAVPSGKRSIAYSTITDLGAVQEAVVPLPE
ncbi:fimbria/pilus periplasmic chaperone [Stenotrophomonas pennii]|uniref:fimbrial biogenesis chaperone n=1 Tax=Stenotrophomonas lacuserhaii TaxID=2760084 RepID=UPI0032085773